MNEKITTIGKKFCSFGQSYSDKKKKKIVTLGLSSSGKTNFIVAAMAYAAMYGGKLGAPFDELCKLVLSKSYNWSVKVVSTETFRVIDILLVDYFNKGRWCDKTSRGTYKNYTFDLRGNVAFSPPYFRSPKSVTIRDWAGESFDAIVEGTSTQDKVDTFKSNCAEADGFLLCIDGARLLDEDKGNRMRDCITNFCEVIGWLRDDDSGDFSGDDTNGQQPRKNTPSVIKNRKRSFAIVITKADLLLNRFPGENKDKLSLYKLNEFLRRSYPLFFNALDEQNCRAEIFAVSLVPKREFRNDTDSSGRIPSDQWNLEKVMECALVEEAENDDCKRYHNNMWGAFRWLLDSV